MSRDTTLYGLSRKSYTRKAVYIMIESGALYFAAQLVFVVTYGITNPAELIALNIATQTYVSSIIDFRAVSELLFRALRPR